MIINNISLKPFNSFGIEARASHFARFDSTDALCEILNWAKKHPTKIFENPLVLGGGSNILLTRDIDGLVLKNEIPGIEVLGEDEDHYWVSAGAGVVWHQFVMYCLQHNMAGAENLALIPGNVGASPMQNIGAYGVEIKDIFHSLEAWHIHDLVPVQFSHSDCAFDYRDSVFKHKHKSEFVITKVQFRLNKKPVFKTAYGAIQQQLEEMKVEDLSIQAIAEAVIQIRSSKLPDPKKIGNAGSFFKNPELSNEDFQRLQLKYPDIVGYPLHGGKVKLAAGWMIEQCGWKGYRIGDAGCHEKQALVLVNYGAASGDEILRLSKRIQEDVLQKFNVTLQTEVNIIE